MAGKTIAVVRVRGIVDIDHRYNDTMRMLGLTRVNHCSLVGEGQRGMVTKCKDYLTWGEIDADTLAALVQKRGLKPGNKKLTAEDVAKAGFKSVEDYAAKFLSGDADHEKLGIKKIFRLHPPRKGHGQIKKLFPQGGLGDRKGEINALLKRMM